MWLAIATAAFLAASFAYHFGFFRTASVLGIGYAAVAAVRLRAELGHTPGVLAAVLLLLLPALSVGVHAIDVRRGLFLLPTLYTIFFAFVGATLALVLLLISAVLP